MSYEGATGEASAVAVTAGEMRQLRYASGTVGTFVATGAITRGHYGLYRWEMRPSSGGAGAHFHRTFTESFYVLEGEPTFFDGRAWQPRRAGELVFVPEGGIHGFRNDSPAPASFLILFAPGVAREAYFEELLAIGHAAREMTRADWDDLYARHDQVMVETPPD